MAIVSWVLFVTTDPVTPLYLCILYRRRHSRRPLDSCAAVPQCAGWTGCFRLARTCSQRTDRRGMADRQTSSMWSQLLTGSSQCFDYSGPGSSALFCSVRWPREAYCSSPAIIDFIITSPGLFCSICQLSSIWELATPWMYFLYLSLSSVILTDPSMGSPVHVLMLSVQAVRGLPRLRAPGTVHCIISSNCLVSSWCDHSMLASLLWRCLKFPLLCLQ